MCLVCSVNVYVKNTRPNGDLQPPVNLLRFRDKSGGKEEEEEEELPVHPALSTSTRKEGGQRRMVRQYRAAASHVPERVLGHLRHAHIYLDTSDVFVYTHVCMFCVLHTCFLGGRKMSGSVRFVCYVGVHHHDLRRPITCTCMCMHTNLFFEPRNTHLPHTIHHIPYIPAFLAICIIGALRERMRMLTPALRSSPSTRSRKSFSVTSRPHPTPAQRRITTGDKQNMVRSFGERRGRRGLGWWRSARGS